MRAIKETIRTFILNIRRSEEPIKRRWVYVLSGGLSLLVLLLWVGYLNVALPKLSQPPDVVAAETGTAAEPQDHSGSFFSVLGRGFRNIIDTIKTGASSFGDTFSNTYENAKKSFGGTKTDVHIAPPASEPVTEPLFLDLNGTSSPTSSPNTL